MRSDYYTPVQPDAPLTPLPPPKKAKKKAKGLPLFFCFLILMGVGSAYLAAQTGLPGPSPDWDRWLPDYFEPYIFGPSDSLLPLPSPEPLETTIRTLDPPGESTLTLQKKGEDVLAASEIYAAVSPAILSVEAFYETGGGAEGTGVIFDSNGYFVTNAHVISGSERVNVTLSSGKTYPAFLIGMDEETDLAVLKFSGKNLPTAPFGSDLDLVVGEDVYAIGNPLGSQFRGSITEGIISGIDRSVAVEGYDMTLIQTSAAINTGSSGGALLNTRGQVVGITNMKMISWYATVEGLGFAIPATTVERVVGDLMRVGYVAGRPVLGITVRPALVPEECATAGLYVDEVNPKSDAWAKGLRATDVLLTANDIPLETNADLLTLRTGLVAGDTLTLGWLPGGKGNLKTADVTLVEGYLLEQE